MKELHLICNSHIDPCWQWDLDEGIACALSTFRCAADFCDEYDALIFNHNEALLYEYVEKYDPALFQRIKNLVQNGKWHIMGGWYLQPDCNLPSGESFVRQIMTGRKYFKDKFNVRPTTAMNVDSFGHTRGLVQIMKKAGYDSYFFCRPFQKDMYLEQDDFIWEGYDGSQIQAFRSFGIYNSLYGMAANKIEEWINKYPDKSPGCVLWGVGIQFPCVEKGIEPLGTGMLQFHDILPGSGIGKVEETGIRKINYGLDILTEIRSQSFFKLCENEPKAKADVIPIFIYNPHPFEIEDVFECEFMLANMVHMNPCYFSSLFHQSTGLPFKSYIIELRLHEAQRQLLQTNENISTIAFNCGFTNMSNFNRLYKKRIGQTPKETRQIQ